MGDRESKVMNFNEIMGKINNVSLKLALMVMMAAVVSLTGCSSGEPVVVHPVEFAEPEEDEQSADEISEAEEAGIVFGNVNEEASEDTEDVSEEDAEEFVQIEPDESEVRSKEPIVYPYEVDDMGEVEDLIDIDQPEELDDMLKTITALKIWVESELK